MKKFLLALLALTGSAAPLYAWGGTFGLFVCPNSCHCCTGSICLKQYNAFSPFAAGTICLSGLPMNGQPLYRPAGGGALPDGGLVNGYLPGGVSYINTAPPGDITRVDPSALP